MFVFYVILNAKNEHRLKIAPNVMHQKIYHHKQIVVVWMTIILMVKSYNVINVQKIVKCVIKKIIAWNVMKNLYVLKMLKMKIIKLINRMMGNIKIIVLLKE